VFWMVFWLRVATIEVHHLTSAGVNHRQRNNQI